MKKKMIVIDAKKCTGCKTCELECAVAHSKSKTFEGALGESPLPQSRIMVEGVDILSVPLQCRHCENAPCVAICPTSALTRDADTAVVRFEKERCIGCRWCMLVCPFGSIKSGREGRGIVKCDLCEERRALGKGPACVEGCPTRALRFEDLEDVTRDLRRKTLGTFLVTFRDN
jgi:carbon-monoxide dehydrogenase iron sulfur subunit